MLRVLPTELARFLDTVSLTFTLEQFLTNDSPAVQSWSVDAVAHHWDDRDENGHSREEFVGRMNLVKGSLVSASLLDQLDDLEGDLETVGSVLLDHEVGDLRADVEDGLVGTGSTLLILNSVVLEKRWRGYGLGALLAGEALLALGGDAHCIATIPAPLDESVGAARLRAIRKLERVWASIGFRNFDRGVWILDPGLIDLRDSVVRLKGNFGLDVSDGNLDGG